MADIKISGLPDATVVDTTVLEVELANGDSGKTTAAVLAGRGADTAYARQTSSAQVNSGATLTLDLNTPNQSILMTANCTLAAPTLPAADQTQSGIILFTQDGSTAFTLSYSPASIKINGGAIDISTLGGVYEMPWVRRGGIIHASIVGPFA